MNLHRRWRVARRRSTGFADPQHPFRHQGSADLNLYKLFLEAAHALAGKWWPDRVPRSIGALLGQRHRGSPGAVPGTLPLGVAVRHRKPRQDLPNRQPCQVQPRHHRKGRVDRGDPDRLHAPGSGGLGARRGSGHAVHARAGRAVQPQEPGDPRDSVPARSGDPGEDLRQLRAPRRRRARWVGGSSTRPSST